MANGGTGINSSGVVDGQLLIGGTASNDFQLGNLAPGNLIQILEGTNTIEISCAITPQPTPAANSAAIINALATAGIFV